MLNFGIHINIWVMDLDLLLLLLLIEFTSLQRKHCILRWDAHQLDLPVQEKQNQQKIFHSVWLKQFTCSTVQVK
jgi:hypothetical protein